MAEQFLNCPDIVAVFGEVAKMGVVERDANASTAVLLSFPAAL